jgi:hypothetical protein
VASSPNRLIKCVPMGSPASFQNNGTDIAGWPLALQSGVNGTNVVARIKLGHESSTAVGNLPRRRVVRPGSGSAKRRRHAGSGPGVPIRCVHRVSTSVPYGAKE